MAAQAPPNPQQPVRRRLPWRSRIQYLYLLRVPILIGAAVVSLPIVSLFKFRQLLGNLFVVNLWNIFWSVLATQMLTTSILVVTRVVLLNGKERFGVRQGLRQDIISRAALLFAGFLGLPMFLGIVFSNNQAASGYDALQRLGVVVGGLIVAGILGFAVLLASVYVSPRYHVPAQDRFPLPFAFMRKWISAAYNATLFSDQSKQRFADWIKKGKPCVTAGYFDRRTHLPYPGQILSFSMLFLSYGLYKFIGYLKHAHLGEPYGVPAIAYVIVLLIVWNWIFSIAAFFLDRFRMPLLVPCLLFVIITNLNTNSDHFYEIRQCHKPSVISPYQVVTAPFRLNPDQNHPHGRITVIATAGGGIQAAAWTAEVLTGLQTEVRADSVDKSFANSIAAISSVSGGAVGTMFFVNQYQASAADHGFPPTANPAKIVNDAEGGALGDIAWAMVYPDLTRVVFPFFKGSTDRLIDRGWALEQTWRTRGHLDAMLDDWRSGVNEGWRPAVFFNSTIVESGEPLLLATTDLNQKTLSGVGRKSVATFLPGYDVPVVTAVRLAASFPYVSPASRAAWDESQQGSAGNDPKLETNSKYHVVDGGYYDNYGVNSLLAFLDEALSSIPKGEAPDILFIQIRSFPSEATGPEGKRRGWFYQTWAPIDALMEVRTTGQLVRDREAIDNFVALWSARGVKIRLATFEFPGNNAPLSWQMNEAQTEAIKSQWTTKIKGPNNEDWQQVNCFFHPSEPECVDKPLLKTKGAW